MRRRIALLLFATVAGAASSASAQRPLRHRPPPAAVETVGSPGGRAPWNAPWEYDSGSDNDRRPELPYYQQGRGQQTGGPARNLLPDDGLHLFPR